MHNSVTVEGRLVTDVAIADGRATFRILVHGRRWDRSRRELVAARPALLPVVCEGLLAAGAARTLGCDDHVIVVGRLRAGGRSGLEIQASAVGRDVARAA